MLILQSKDGQTKEEQHVDHHRRTSRRGRSRGWTLWHLGAQPTE